MLTPYSIVKTDIIIPIGNIGPLMEVLKSDSRSELVQGFIASRYDAVVSNPTMVIKELMDHLNVHLNINEFDDHIRLLQDRRWDFDSAHDAQYVIENMLAFSQEASWCEWAICGDDIHHRWSKRGPRVVDQTATLIWSEPQPLILEGDER